MYWFIFLSAFFFQVQAADDGSDVSSHDIACRLQEMKKEESRGQFDGEGRFVYHQREEYNPLPPIKDFMQKVDGQPYFEYFVILASSKLNDKEKVAKRYVYIPPFDQLSQKEQANKNEALIELLHIDDYFNYSVRRLLFAALLHAQVEVKNKKGGELLKKAALQDDIPLVKIILKNGADPKQHIRYNSVLSYAKSKEMAKLLIDYGADASKASCYGSDLIYKICAYEFGSKSNELLRFYLQHVPLSESNQRGLIWMEKVAIQCYKGLADLIIERVKMLLEYGCVYNEEIKKQICGNVAEKSSEAKEQIERVFQDHEMWGKNIKGARR